MNVHSEQTQRSLSNYFDAVRSVEGPDAGEVDAIVAQQVRPVPHGLLSRAVRNLAKNLNTGVGPVVGITSVLAVAGVGAVLLFDSPDVEKRNTNGRIEENIAAIPEASTETEPTGEDLNAIDSAARYKGGVRWVPDNTRYPSLRSDPLMPLERAMKVSALPDSAMEVVTINKFEREKFGSRPLRLGEVNADYTLYTVHNVESVNTPETEYSPSVTRDGKRLFFVSDRADGNGGHDVWSAVNHDPSSINFSTPVNVGPPINTRGNEGMLAISADGGRMYFTACNRPDGMGDCDLYEARFDGKKWYDIRNVEAINSSFWDSQPSLSESGDTLYFVSNRPGAIGGNGDADIYRAIRRSDGSWEAPINIGAPVNTSKREDSPFILPGSSKLYFSSAGHGGYGRLDFFVATFDRSGEWNEPQNLGPVFNSSMDERMLTGSADEEVFYFASERNSPMNLGGLDIFVAVRPTSDVDFLTEMKRDESSEFRINIFPNPSTDFIRFSIPEGDKDVGDVVIVDNNGWEVRRLSGSAHDGPIQVADLPNGTYMIRVGKYTGSFVVQK